MPVRRLHLFSVLCLLSDWTYNILQCCSAAVMQWWRMRVYGIIAKLCCGSPNLCKMWNLWPVVGNGEERRKGKPRIFKSIIFMQ